MHFSFISYFIIWHQWPQPWNSSDAGLDCWHVKKSSSCEKADTEPERTRGGEYLEAGQQSCLWLVGCGHCVLSWVKSALSPWWWLWSVQVVRWGMVVLAPTALAVGGFSLQCPCPCSFSVDGDSLKFLTEQGSSHHPGPAEGLGSCTEQLCPTTWQDAQMWSCSMIPGTHNPLSQWFMFSLCIVMGTDWKDFGCWHIKLHNLHFLVEEKAKENALNSLSVGSRNVVQGSVITWGMS